VFNGNFRMAIASLRSNRWRSLLTMTGIIIGVVSVVTTVSLGEGIKRQVVGQINRFGSDIITIKPGKIVERDNEGRISKVKVKNGYSFANASLPAKDIETITKTSGVDEVVPVSVITGNAVVDKREYNQGTIIGTSASLPDLLNHKIQYGAFFEESDSEEPVAVIGRNVAYKLFDSGAPIGMSMSIHGQNFVVRGVFEVFETPPLALGPDFNNAIFIPYPMAQELTGGNSQLAQVLVRPKSAAQTNQTVASLNRSLLDSRGGQEDFTVLRQDENLIVTSDVLNILTAFVAGIAAISLVVGGVGIMNIMLVSVTERTREIGIRKAIGATNKQIMSQFLIEAVVLSCGGAIVGFILAALVVAGIRLATHLQPVITWPIAVVAMLAAILIGVLFGLMPAAKAASKDPIDALRYE
jgi:putative ABC transport system permease protein